ncbi:MAG: MBL fold metallo-hydrolase [Dermatophilaceae bacterium]
MANATAATAVTTVTTVLGTNPVLLSGAPAGLVVYQMPTAGLGDHSYLLSDGTAAAVIDPQRDLDRFEDGLAALGVPLAAVAETHVHNDYVSGGRALSRRHWATHVLPADAGYRFDHHAVRDGDELAVGGLVIRAMHTPGHTLHHTSYLVLADGEVVLVFSGGCVLVGACGRTDLISPERTEGLTRDQYRSATRILDLADPVAIGLTHGQGSFCSASAASMETYTPVGAEHTRNPAALAKDEDDFVQGQLAGLLAYPAYYTKMAGFNVEGPDSWEPAEMSALSAEQVADREQAGVVIVDGRSRHEFAARHIPGSVNIERDENFSTYLGWLFPFGAKFVLVTAPDADPMDAVRQSARIGIETIEGYLEGGIAAWEPSGRPLRSYDVTDVDGLKQAMDAGDVRVLDVRQDLEWSDGHVPDAVHIHVPDIRDRVKELADSTTPVSVICRTGHRASMAASVVDAAQIPTVLVDGGFPDWAEWAVSPTGLSAATPSSYPVQRYPVQP